MARNPAPPPFAERSHASTPPAGGAARRPPDAPGRAGGIKRWPLVLLALPAAVATWSGWVGLGEKTGFGMVKLLPGLTDFELNTAITLPIGVEAYAAFALSAWLTSADVAPSTRRFAKTSALGSLALGMLGQIAYHLLETAKLRHAPPAVVVVVACLPVLVLGMGAALGHMLARDVTHAPVPAGTGPDTGPPDDDTTTANDRNGAGGEVIDVTATVHTTEPPLSHDSPGYVPEPLPEALATRAASRFLPDVITGDVPGVRAIKAELGIGQDKAQQVRAYLTGLAKS
ncbi:hypothetical protein [Spongiactinospora sp. TRM90649]|uniref:hypothetical protein n=1 Tax=Spongiactinospora sp. TRM90649 TaxID=3031114 RepID=UPI0023F75D56|nr:hypothetical protein [Spongiactinospora sp. TRM90649]MDF5758641.1 hypothetical protein [Spongiactinospora sp. TRM90649]